MPFRDSRFKVAGNYRYVALCATPPARHTPRPMPPPDAAHFARLAEDKRREAASIVRHIRKSDQSPSAHFARRQAEELYRAAEDYEALAQRGDQ